MARTVLVTGSSRGIGAAIAGAFAAAGDRVAVHATTAQRARQAGVGEAAVGADLADPDAVRAMVDEAAAVLGHIDVVVNNAGVIGQHPIDTTSYEDWQAAWRRTIDVNLIGAANVCWCALRHMPEGGAIVNVASRGAFRGEPRQPAYGASKAGVLGLTQSLARALGPRSISVTAIAPGFTDTDMAAEALAGDERARREAESPLNRIAQPEEVAAAVLYLASPEARMASGTVLDFNGASHLRL